MPSTGVGKPLLPLPGRRREMDHRDHHGISSLEIEAEAYQTDHVSARKPARIAGLDHVSVHTSLWSFLLSRCFTTFPTSCACSRVVMSNASGVSTTTRLLTPTAATYFPGAWT